MRPMNLGTATAVPNSRSTTHDARGVCARAGGRAGRVLARFLAVALLSGALLLPDASLTPTGSQEAEAHAAWLTPALTWSQYGSTQRLSGSAWGNRWHCGVKACSRVAHVSAQVAWQGGTWPSRARVSPSMTLQTVSGSVSVSTGGAGLGFSVSGETCHAGWWQANGGNVSVDFGSQDICVADSWWAVGTITYAVTGGTLIGSSWTARTSSRSM